MSDTENYEVQTTVFQGPLDLLLHLIEKRKLHICDISLSKIVDDYINYLQDLKKFSIPSSADFILTASILMLIKSKSLLPTLDLSLEEEESIAELETRLKEYQKIKELSRHIQEKFGQRIIFARQPACQPVAIFSPSEDLTMANLRLAIKTVLQNLPRKILTPQAIIDKVISLEKVIENLTDRIKTSLQMSFQNFSGMNGGALSKQEKVGVVVSFLALLELVKQGIIAVNQECGFGEIDMRAQEMDTPNYDSISPNYS